MEASQSQKNIRPLSARKINPIKASGRKKNLKITDSNKLLRRISPKVVSPNVFESSSVRNAGTTGRTLSSEFTMTPTEINKALVRFEREHSDLLSLYSKLTDDLLHLRTLEKLEKQKEKQIAQAKARLLANNKEKTDLQSGLKMCENIFKDFSKKMEKGGLTAEEKRILIIQIQNFFMQTGNKTGNDEENDKKNILLTELWDLLPKTEQLINKLENK
ncbi:hypothetical protein SteCoe_2443 [Stentor coeruleus]|uniref:Uncharacterized protein n=1 Tax=Stentor coeruleus TaxID=5963 RepID=A0A1R2CZI1_9CILI|nr:hypothetical protein SteCoe_2443 [Stentor coeruleus]